MADSTRETEEVEAIIAVRVRACNWRRVMCAAVLSGGCWGRHSERSEESSQHRHFGQDSSLRSE
jgi:hypothetical protein